MDYALPEILKKMMTAVSESEEGPSLWGMGVVAVTILVRVLHALAQKELSLMVMEEVTDISPAVLTFGLTLLQVGAALGVFRVSGLSLTTSPAQREAAILGMASYAGGMYLVTYLLWSDDTAATACYGAQEPALCLLLLYVAARIPTDQHRAGAVVALCLGAALLTADLALLGSVGALLRVVGSVFLLVRNMVVKHLYDSSVGFEARGQNTLLGLAAGATVVSVLGAVLMSGDLLLAALMLVVCGALAATLMHLTLTLLSLYDTLTVAVFMLWAQVLENVVLLGAESRPTLLGVFLGAALFAAGHYYYFREGVESGTVHLNIKQVGVNELFTRLQFIMYGGVILALLAVLLRPYLNGLDVIFLSYIGIE